MVAALSLQPIAVVRSPYRQKFAIPRQPNLVPQARGEIVFLPDYADANALRGLEAFSHLWLIFHFHDTAAAGWRATVSPPRLGGKARVGVFASRSMYRPNALGLSVVENAGWRQQGDRLLLEVRGIDLLDGTPLLDIKPYLPWADALPRAGGAWAEQAPPRSLQVRFSPQAQAQLEAFQSSHPEIEDLIRGVLQQDPRPAQHVRNAASGPFAMLMYDINVRWRVEDGSCEVLDLEHWAGTVPQAPCQARDASS